MRLNTHTFTVCSNPFISSDRYLSEWSLLSQFTKKTLHLDWERDNSVCSSLFRRSRPQQRWMSHTSRDNSLAPPRLFGCSPSQPTCRKKSQSNGRFNKKVANFKDRRQSQHGATASKQKGIHMHSFSSRGGGGSGPLGV